MANIKISELTAITGANTAADDEFVIVDTSATETKKITRAELAAAIGAGVVDSVNTQTGDVVLDADDISDTSTTNKYTTAGDISKLAAIEASADVTDATNVAAAGAAMLTGATFTGDVSFGTNDKANFNSGGFGLEVYNDGFNSYFDGNSGTSLISGTQVKLMSSGGETMVQAQTNGAVTLYHNNSAKLATTATGIDVTGTATADGATFTGVVNINATTGYGNLEMGGPSGAFIDFKSPFVDDKDARIIYDGSNFVISTNADQPVILQQNNSTKLNTTSTGINVTGSVVSQVGINAQTGTTYTTVLADQSKLVTLTNASAITLTIPANSSVAYPVGTQIDLSQFGAGQVTVAGAGGVTVNSASGLKLRVQYSSASCVKVDTDTWLLVGDLEA